MSSRRPFFAFLIVSERSLAFTKSLCKTINVKACERHVPHSAGTCLPQETGNGKHLPVISSIGVPHYDEGDEDCFETANMHTDIKEY